MREPTENTLKSSHYKKRIFYDFCLLKGLRCCARRALMIHRFESKKYLTSLLKAFLITLCLSAASLGSFLYTSD